MHESRIYILSDKHLAIAIVLSCNVTKCCTLPKASSEIYNAIFDKWSIKYIIYTTNIVMSDQFNLATIVIPNC